MVLAQSMMCVLLPQLIYKSKLCFIFQEALTDISYESFTVSSSVYDCENDGSKELVKSAHDFYTRNVFS